MAGQRMERVGLASCSIMRCKKRQAEWVKWKERVLAANQSRMSEHGGGVPFCGNQATQTVGFS